ncbi:MerR family transcriptional regulator (plasmid) [Pseudonocardia sp. EC080619-01]|uniref:TOBE domain-containing protein n=1 Tax=Pseudonocardia sp. EC080619-01 TaxID=1096856 RepID=UPI0007068A6E|nr:TOBE domain-containing protein [Pseudonocardia sp. EC080619-01]ALL85436.1 MerR family transcriptional regulator [Pseudonocardia sp. EC080619-01]
MPQYRVITAARIMGVGEDAVRRWIGAGELPSTSDRSNRMVVEGAELAGFARDRPGATVTDPSPGGRSARNRMVGLVTSVVTDLVMAKVEMQCGPHRVVSLISSEAARDLQLEPGSMAVAIVKSTDVVIEVPHSDPAQATPPPPAARPGRSDQRR